jgi:hypothetical protein
LNCFVCLIDRAKADLAPIVLEAPASDDERAAGNAHGASVLGLSRAVVGYFAAGYPTISGSPEQIGRTLALICIDVVSNSSNDGVVARYGYTKAKQVVGFTIVGDELGLLGPSGV